MFHNRSIQTSVVTLLLITVNAAPVLGWGDAGHRLVAAIAFRRLSPAQRDHVVSILEDHPRFQEDFLDVMPDEIQKGTVAARNEWLFQRAAVWPDIVRAPTHDGHVYHQAHWHYINLPLFLSPADQQQLAERLTVNISLAPPDEPTEKMNAIQTIALARRTLSDKHSSAEDRGLMLAWLFHLTGDIAQPAHSTAMFSARRFPEGDKGGNSIPTTQRQNLHALWDKFPGTQMSFREARNESFRLLDSPELAQAGDAAAAILDEQKWLEESHQLAQAAVYAPEVMTYLRMYESVADPDDVAPLSLSAEYLKAGGQLADRRIVEAGCRLAAILKAFSQ